MAEQIDGLKSIKNDFEFFFEYEANFYTKI